MLKNYHAHVAERALLGIPPLPLSKTQTMEVIGLLKNPPAGQEKTLRDLLVFRVPGGVDEAAKVKAEFLARLLRKEERCPLISPVQAAELLGTMLGGYNVKPLIEALADPEAGPVAANSLKHTLLVFEDFGALKSLADRGNLNARSVLRSWAEGEWFTSRPETPALWKLTVFKVSGETNTDDLSPAPDASTRPDIPLHALAMLKNPRAGIEADEPGRRGPVRQIQSLARAERRIVYAGDVVGTGSSRKSAVNSLLWFIGEDLPFIPNKRFGGICLGTKIAPIFFNTLEDAGALPVEIDVSRMEMGDEIDLHIDAETLAVAAFRNGEALAESSLKTPTLLDEARAGGRIPLIIGRRLTARAREALGLPPSTLFRWPQNSPGAENAGNAYSLAQKIVGRACGLPEGQGMRPGNYCEPSVTTVGSQDTTGPMTRDELIDIACLSFSAGLVMQSFCHTCAYPKPVDLSMHRALPEFMTARGGVALRPGDGIIHSWLNRMLLPDTVGTGGDSHTRFPIGLSFPAGSGLVAFAAATGTMPLDMPESVLVRFSGSLQPGLTLRDLVNAIPLFAIRQGLLTIEKKNKKNIFSGRILEIEGLPDLKVEQAFELTDASAERSAAASTVHLNKEPVLEYMRSNVALLEKMRAEGYQSADALQRRINAMKAWIARPELLSADPGAPYAAVIEIDLNVLREPVVACPNDPDDVRLLSEVAGEKIDEVFIGSCMTHIGHFRVAGKILENRSDIPARLWLAPPTRMDAETLRDEGIYAIFGKAGARLEMPGCSLCMGNQAQIHAGSVAMSTSTRNFPNRLGIDTRVYLGSAELAAVCALLGRIPTVPEYQEHVKNVTAHADEIYRYARFDVPAGTRGV